MSLFAEYREERVLMIDDAMGSAETEPESLREAAGLTREEFEYFAEQNRERLMSVASRMLKSSEDAADALQDALLAAYVARGRFRSQSTVYTWLYRIVVRTCLMKIRSSRARKRSPCLGWSSDGADFRLEIEDPRCTDPCLAIERTETLSGIQRWLKELPKSYQQVLVLRDVDGLSTIEVARQLHVSTDTVKSRIHRARHRLRELVDASANKACASKG